MVVPRPMQRVYQYRLSDGSQPISYLSWQDIGEIGCLPGEAILGYLDSDTVSVDHWRRNSVFVEFLHKIVKKAAPDDPELQWCARESGAGYAYVIDLRTADGPQGRVPVEDIIGSFSIIDGSIVRDSYRPNPNYRVLTAQGFTLLPTGLHAVLIAALKSPGLLHDLTPDRTTK